MGESSENWMKRLSDQAVSLQSSSNNVDFESSER